jgi:hypothetical protein
MADILRALDRNEKVTILHRGKERAVLLPLKKARLPKMSARDHPAFGMWRDRSDMRDVRAYVRKLREARPSAD